MGDLCRLHKIRQLESFDQNLLFFMQLTMNSGIMLRIGRNFVD